MARRTLTDLELRILAFEERWEGRRGGKEAALRTEFGWSLTAYEQRLRMLLMVPAALEVNPMLVHRAIAARETKRRLRAARSLRLVG